VNPARNRAAALYRELHWGIKPRRMRKVRVEGQPKALAELGKLEAVTYATTKRGDGPSSYTHTFGEEGGARPSLAVDTKTRRLHIVGGDYRVESRGIVD
jgi:hypothetical protein